MHNLHSSNSTNEYTSSQTMRGAYEVSGELIDNQTLFKSFAEGETRFLGNHIFQLDYKFEQLQITSTKNGELIAFSKKASEKGCFAFVKYDSKYWEIIHQTLLENKFMPVGQSEQQKGFFEYQQYDIPNGYQAHFTEAVNLWKAWWPTKRNRNFALKLDLIIFANNKWYSVQDIDNNGGTFYVKTSVGDIVVETSTKLVWANKIQSNAFTSQVASIPKENNQSITEASELRAVQNNRSVSNSKLIETEIIMDTEDHLKQLKIKALKALDYYLSNGDTETQTEVIKNEKGEITGTKTITVKKPCPQWVIEQLINRDDY